jgi:hypothetical protein
MDDFLAAYGPDELKRLSRYPLSDPIFAQARSAAERGVSSNGDDSTPNLSLMRLCDLLNEPEEAVE